MFTLLYDCLRGPVAFSSESWHWNIAAASRFHPNREGGTRPVSRAASKVLAFQPWFPLDPEGNDCASDASHHSRETRNFRMVLYGYSTEYSRSW
jgi:hypothetical protein